MESAIVTDPECGVVVPGSGGLRKVRFPYGGSGKSGGGRTIYYAGTADGLLFLLFCFAKVDQTDLSSTQKKQFRALLKELTDG